MNTNYQTILTADDVVDVWLRNNNIKNAVTTDTAEFDEYNTWTNYFDSGDTIRVEQPSTLAKDEFVTKCISEDGWKLPEKYKNMDVEQWLFDRVQQTVDTDDIYTSTEWIRVKNELREYNKRGLQTLLKFLVYFIDTLRDHNIVWGVGRGSSVASYILYLIGVHKVNSIRYNLDIAEFLK